MSRGQTRFGHLDLVVFPSGRSKRIAASKGRGQQLPPRTRIGVCSRSGVGPRRIRRKTSQLSFAAWNENVAVCASAVFDAKARGLHGRQPLKALAKARRLGFGFTRGVQAALIVALGDGTWLGDNPRVTGRSACSFSR